MTTTPPPMPALSPCAAILLREHDDVDQAIRYAERMSHRYAAARSFMAIEYQDAAQELKVWKQNKHR